MVRDASCMLVEAVRLCSGDADAEGDGDGGNELRSGGILMVGGSARGNLGMRNDAKFAPHMRAGASIQGSLSSKVS